MVNERREKEKERHVGVGSGEGEVEGAAGSCYLLCGAHAAVQRREAAKGMQVRCELRCRCSVHVVRGCRPDPGPGGGRRPRVVMTSDSMCIFILYVQFYYYS